MTSLLVIYAYKGWIVSKSKFNQIDFPNLGPCVDSSSCYAAPPDALLLFSSSEPERSMEKPRMEALFFKRNSEESTKHKVLAINK